MAIFGKKKTKPVVTPTKPVATPKEEAVKDSLVAKKVAKATSATSKKTPAEKTKTIETKSSTKKPFHVAKRKGRRQTARQNMAEELSRVLLRPRITEKATDVTANRTYVFEVAVNATKRDVSKAVEHYYKVKPTKVNLIKIPSKKRRNRNRRTFGRSSVGKKAYVFLKEGDSIEFV